jgi:hypothetical protein
VLQLILKSERLPIRNEQCREEDAYVSVGMVVSSSAENQFSMMVVYMLAEIVIKL